MPTGLSSFPIKSGLGFVKASRLRFRRVAGKPKTDKKYQEIRFISQVALFGWLNFLNPDAPDDLIYTKLHLRVSISNFPNSSFGDFVSIVTPTSSSATVTYYPSKEVHMANYDSIIGADGTTTKTATTMTQTGTGFTQVWTLSDPLTIREWQKRMVDNLAYMVPKVQADFDAVIAASGGTITIEDMWDNIWLCNADRSIQNVPGVHVKDYSGGLVSDNPPTGNLPEIAGRILQIERGPNATGNETFIDIMGVSGGYYYPGSQLPMRRNFTAPETFEFPLIQYESEDAVYHTEETLSCSQTKHRIQVPICKALLHGTLGPTERLTPPADLPAVYSYGATVGFGFSPNDPGEVEVATPCPALSIADFWNAGTAPDQYWEYQLSSNDPSTNINDYVIPPTCGLPPSDDDDGDPTA